MGSMKKLEIKTLKESAKGGGLSFVITDEQHDVRCVMEDICSAIDSIELSDWAAEDIETALAIEYPNHISTVSIRKKQDDLYQINVRVVGPIYNIEIDWEESSMFDSEYDLTV